MKLVSALVISLCAWSTTTWAEDVTVTYGERTFPVSVAQNAARRSSPEKIVGPGNYPIKATKKIEQHTVPVIELSNGLVKAVIAPE